MCSLCFYNFSIFSLKLEFYFLPSAKQDITIYENALGIFLSFFLLFSLLNLTSLFHIVYRKNIFIEEKCCISNVEKFD